jgi:hypothetical protein
MCQEEAPSRTSKDLCGFSLLTDHQGSSCFSVVVLGAGGAAVLSLVVMMVFT